MPLCVLCKRREADKTGSHVVSAFLLTSLVGRRNKEIGFEISSEGYVKKYFGREVNADAIRDVLGRELTEEDILENENHFTVDHLFCTECENRLGALESLSAPKIQGIKKGEFKLMKGASLDYFETDANVLLRCLFYSIAFRISAADKFDYNLNPFLREWIRSILDKTLSIEPDVFQDNLRKNGDEIVKIPFAIFYAPLDEDDSANQIYSHRQTSIPSFIIVNEFVICLYNRITHVDFDFGTIYTFNKSIIKEAINFRESVMRISFISSRKKINDSLVSVIVKRMLQNLGARFRRFYVAATGRYPSFQQIAAFAQEMATDETNLSDKLTEEFINAMMMKHLNGAT